ncbi:hypothetical protein NPX13_g1807 [Xylaria arbuscula]|uniref:Major facilitator superfamily (MFS) profile domain-containing protein n=1 Tax=Xylaria arbuscula TaxID=114810 RepID=A0A9W8NKS0_9PEZI|nr:hypothetical protein NPX13_g1807 [Xylaria arbuscula]
MDDIAKQEVEHADRSIGEPPTAEEERAVIRKLDWRLMPMIFTIYSLSVLDRSNLGNAHVAGLDETLGLKGDQYSTLGTFFYVTYIIFQSAAAGWKHFPAHIWVTCIIASFATISAAQAATQNYAGIVVLRLLLGATEAMYAGVPVYLSFFYPRDRVGFRQGIFLSGSALANAYGGALGYAITQIKSRLKPWRILFLIEGLPTYIMAVVAWFFFPDDIESAKFLTEREKQVVKHMVSREQTADVVNHTGLRLKDFLAAFKDWRNRVKMRGPFVCFFGIVSAIGFLLLATTEGPVPRYLGVYLAITIFVSVAILIPWVSNSHNTESKRAGGFAIFATFGQAGPLLGTNIFPSKEAPYYRKGSWISFSFCVLVAVTSAIFSLLLRRENRRLDRLMQSEEGEDVDRSRRGFRYVI